MLDTTYSTVSYFGTRKSAQCQIRIHETHLVKYVYFGYWLLVSSDTYFYIYTFAFPHVTSTIGGLSQHLSFLDSQVDDQRICLQLWERPS
jgi:hypothetical protein